MFKSSTQGYFHDMVEITQTDMIDSLKTSDNAGAKFSALSFPENDLSNCGSNPTTGEKVSFAPKLQNKCPSGASATESSSIFRMIQTIESEDIVSSKKWPEFGVRIIPTSPGLTLEQLWVDKYAPLRFTELVSSDKTNVDVLKWVSRWKVIKGNQGAITADPNNKKIMLISGPPGLGKTTMVHVIARVAGFKVLEINASDERTGDSVTSKISEALNANTVSDKPNLILIDEIDGAANTASDTGLITYLSKLCTSSNSTNDSEDHLIEGEEEISGPFKKKAKRDARSKATQLCRPIICVCNNLYAPALKPLRQIAEVIQVRRHSPVIVAKHLKSLCEKENFKIDNKSLVDLCEMMECDIRSCLHALQFLSTTKASVVNSADFLKNASLNLKDVGRSSFSIINEIFCNSARKHPLDHSSRMKNLESLLYQISKEEDRVTDACHSVFLNTRFFDDSQLTKVNMAYEWLASDDIFRSSKMKYGYSLSSYLSFTPMMFSHLFSAPVSSSTTYTHTKMDFETKLRGMKNQTILDDYSKGTSARSFCSRTELVLERAPLFQHIIRPSIRTPNPQLLKPGEVLALERIVSAMCNDNVTYIEGRCDDGSYSMVMDPAIDKLTCFSALNILTHHDVAVRKLIAHQVREEKIKKRRLSTNELSESKKHRIDSSQLLAKKKDSFPTKVVKKDFFGRVIQIIENVDADPTSPQNGRGAQISYRFNEGFSNAVRRTFRVRDLFPLQNLL